MMLFPVYGSIICLRVSFSFSLWPRVFGPAFTEFDPTLKVVWPRLQQIDSASIILTPFSAFLAPPLQDLITPSVCLVLLSVHLAPHLVCLTPQHISFSTFSPGSKELDPTALCLGSTFCSSSFLFSLECSSWAEGLLLVFGLSKGSSWLPVQESCSVDERAPPCFSYFNNLNNNCSFFSGPYTQNGFTCVFWRSHWKQRHRRLEDPMTTHVWGFTVLLNSFQWNYSPPFYSPTPASVSVCLGQSHIFTPTPRQML